MLRILILLAMLRMLRVCFFLFVELVVVLDLGIWGQEWDGMGWDERGE